MMILLLDECPSSSIAKRVAEIRLPMQTMLCWLDCLVVRAILLVMAHVAKKIAVLY